MRVVVIGGTGFAGPHVVRALHARGHDVTVYHRGRHEAPLPADVRQLRDEAAGYPVTRFPPALLDPRPDVVLHMIAMGEGDANALVETFGGRARRLVVASSGDVYRAYGILTGLERREPGESVPLAEDAPLRRTLHPYRATATSPQELAFHYEKILVERVVMGDARTPGTVVRLPAVYGPGDAQHRLHPYVRRMADRRPAILLDEAQARWRWTHGYVEDVAHALTLAVTDDRAAGRIYNVGEAVTPTVADRVRALGRALGWPGDVVELPAARLPAHLCGPRALDYRQDIVYDTTRIRDELAYREQVPVEDALRRSAEWELANPPAPASAPDYAAEDAAVTGAARRGRSPGP